VTFQAPGLLAVCHSVLRFLVPRVAVNLAA
jgi:hypothetical protein